MPSNNGGTEAKGYCDSSSSSWSLIESGSSWSLIEPGSSIAFGVLGLSRGKEIVEALEEVLCEGVG